MINFKTELSLVPLLEHLRSVAEETDSPRASLAGGILELFDAIPSLQKETVSSEEIGRHAELVSTALELVAPWSQGVDIQLALVPPFSTEIVHSTEEFGRLDLGSKIEDALSLNAEKVENARIFEGYQQILIQLYELGREERFATVVTATDPETGLDRSYKVVFDRHFLQVRPIGRKPAFDAGSLEDLDDESGGVKTLTELLPPERFLFRGFVLLKAIDVTEQQTISELREDLLDPDALASIDRIDGLQRRIRSLLGLTDLKIGLFYREIAEEVGESDGVRPITRSLLFGTGDRTVDPDDVSSSLYSRLLARRGPILINDLDDIDRDERESDLLSRGIRNLAIVPLFDSGAIIGGLEIGSPNIGDITAIGAMKLEPLIPLFSTTLRRIVEEQENQMQAIIKEHYTAIHPAVEWRFREAARRWIKRRKAGLRVKPEHIVFNDVYSLYGLSDIRGSSDVRNRAIQVDLLAQLKLARSVVAEASRVRSLPVLDEVGFRLIKAIDEVEQDLHSGDDFRILEFLGGEIEELFEQISGLGEGVAERIDEYNAALDPRLGTVYRERKDYEESVMLINDVISSHIEREEERAQGMFPHYFEKFKTDGVDYNIYVGGSLQKSGTFDRIYLSNLRIWQLQMTCGIAFELDAIRSELKKNLEVAHLILVQDIPIAIRFRIDEKQFDVDGAYNVRYEIVKKRIDKAEIRGTGERLTQPNRIAIVYTQDSEAAEYRRYIEYLQASGYLEPEIEELELDDLQGVHGLRALRVSVNLKKGRADQNGEATVGSGESIEGILEN